MSEQLEGEQLLQAITQHVFIVDLHVGWPKLRHQIADAIVEVHDTEHGARQVEKDLHTDPQWTLMPADWSARFTRIEGLARRTLSAASSVSRSFHLLPVVRANEVFQSLRDVREEFYAARDEFARAYPALLEQLKKTLKQRLPEGVVSQISGKLPGADNVRDKFRMAWSIVPVGGGGVSAAQLERLQDVSSRLRGLRGVTGSVRVALEELVDELNGEIRQLDNTPRRVTGAAAEELVSEARQQLREFADDFVQTIMQDCRERLLEATEGLQNLLGKDKSVKQATLRRIGDAVEYIRGFSFIGDADLLRMCDNMEREVAAYSPREVNANPVIANRLAEAVAPVQQAVRDASRMQRNVRNFRNISRRAPAAAS